MVLGFILEAVLQGVAAQSIPGLVCEHTGSRDYCFSLPKYTERKGAGS